MDSSAYERRHLFEFDTSFKTVVDVEYIYIKVFFVTKYKVYFWYLLNRTFLLVFLWCIMMRRYIKKCKKNCKKNVKKLRKVVGRWIPEYYTFCELLFKFFSLLTISSRISHNYFGWPFWSGKLLEHPRRQKYGIQRWKQEGFPVSWCHRFWVVSPIKGFHYFVCALWG